MDLTSQDENESERLKDLEAYGIMDTDPEEVFDQLTFLAAQVCETPIALLSFLDARRQWFKSTYGIKIDEIPRHVSACNNTIVQNGVYEIPDPDLDNCIYAEYMKNNNFHYYAGVPINSKNGHHIGSLCVIDYEPRTLKKEQIQSLHFISRQINDIIEIRREYRDNLQKLNSIGRISHQRDGVMQDVAHKASMRAMAELSTGLIYRLRPLSLTTSKAVERILSGAGEEEVKADLQLIQSSSRFTTATLDSLQKFISAEKEKWMKPVEINEILQTVLNHMEYKFKDKNIELDVSMEPDIRGIGNFFQLTESIFAVLNNAVEAVDLVKDRKIKVRLYVENHVANILISDTGKGVSDKIRPYIFQPFFTTKKANYIGIGLSLAQALIQRHRGNVELENPQNPTMFKIWLPVP